MKRIVALVITLMMLMITYGSIAETSTVVPVDFGDFYLTLDVNTPGQIYEKKHQQLLFIIYPNAENGQDPTGTNLNAVWIKDANISESVIISNYGTDEKTLNEGLKAQWTDELKAEVYEFKKGDLKVTTLGGRPAWTCDMFYKTKITSGENEMEVDTYINQTYVTGDFGTYIFTSTTMEKDLIDSKCMSLLNTLEWK